MTKRIYLDSSDYERFSNPDDIQAQYVLKHILSLKAAGEIEFFYSGIHMFEMLQMDRSSLHHAVRRAKTMETLSSGNCFLTLGDLILAEHESYQRNGRIRFEDVAPNVNRAFGPVLMRSLEDDGNGNFNDDLKITREIMGRPSFRRVLSRILGFNSVVLTKRDFIKRVLELDAAYFASLNVDEKSCLTMTILVAQGVEKFHDLTPSGLCYVFDVLEHDNPDEVTARRNLHNVAKTGLLGLKEERATMRHHLEEFASLGKWAEFLDANFDPDQDIIEGWLEAMEVQRSELRFDDDFLKTFGAIGNLYCAAKHYHHNKLHDPSKTPPKLQHSDGADILHMAYIPYVDYFRSDKLMSDVAVTVAEDSGTVVLKRMEDLLTEKF